MIQLGQVNRLEVIKIKEFGVFLDGGERYGDILLPNRLKKKDLAVGDKVDAFIYMDSEDEVIATMERPYATVNQCASLKVVDINRIGAFLQWGLSKDLLVPYNQQRRPMGVGEYHMVYIYIDQQTGKIVGSSKLHNFLEEANVDFTVNQKVSIQICEQTNLGYKAVIENSHLGVIHKLDVLQPLRIGQRMHGYIKTIRPDGKLDLQLQLQGQEVRDDLGQQILNYLHANGGVSDITDKSSPEEIYQEFQVSKGNYKKALGGLYKKRLIEISSKEIKLL